MKTKFVNLISTFGGSEDTKFIVWVKLVVLPLDPYTNTVTSKKSPTADDGNKTFKIPLFFLKKN